LQRSQLRTKAIKVGHTIAPAWLRPDFGIFGGQQGRRDRTSAIEAERAARLTNRQSKVEKIAAAAQKLQATMPTEQGKNSAKSVVERLKPAVPAPHEEETGTDQAI
jgi:hypothetical protein